jgi:Ca2+-binding RTX toxin-like protein
MRVIRSRVQTNHLLSCGLGLAVGLVLGQGMVTTEEVGAACGTDSQTGTTASNNIEGDVGGDKYDYISALAGKDRVEGLTCADELHGGPDGDEVHGGHGYDDVFGENGDDWPSECASSGGASWCGDLIGGEHNDVVNGGEGRDLVKDVNNSGWDDDWIQGSDGGADEVDGIDGDFADTVAGGPGADDECHYDYGFGESDDTHENGCDWFFPEQ